MNEPARRPAPLSHQNNAAHDKNPPRLLEISNQNPRNIFLEEDISLHIFSASAVMVGVCLTVIGIIKIIMSSTKLETLADDALAFAALLFLAACFLSYIALRQRSYARLHMIEQIADVSFLGGMTIMAAACVMIVYAVI